MLNSKSFQGSYMARSLKLLEGLPLELQTAILEELSLMSDSSYADYETSYKEININGNIYVIHETVLGFIDGLILQLEKIKNELTNNKK